MIGLKAKLIAAAVSAVLLFGAGWKVAGWRHDANLKDALEKQAEDFQHALAVAADKAAEDQQEAVALSSDLEAIRRERDIALDELDTRPTLTRTITKVVTDDAPCTVDALGPDFLRLFNDAATPAGSTEAPSAD